MNKQNIHEVKTDMHSNQSIFALFLNEFTSDESGQGITEYGAMMAFVALLIAMVFMAGQGLTSSVSGLFSAPATALENVVAYSPNSGSSGASTSGASGAGAPANTSTGKSDGAGTGTSSGSGSGSGATGSGRDKGSGKDRGAGNGRGASNGRGVGKGRSVGGRNR